MFPSPLEVDRFLYSYKQQNLQIFICFRPLSR